jgi:hypothetical protein
MAIYKKNEIIGYRECVDNKMSIYCLKCAHELNMESISQPISFYELEPGEKAVCDFCDNTFYGED